MSDKIEHLIDIEIEDERWLEALPDAQNLVESGVTAALNAVEIDGQADVVVLLCDDAEMRALNKEHRAKDKATNVLSFPAPKSMQKIAPGMTHLGDIALGFETCVREAAEQGKSLKNHVLHLSVHGALHLLGYDHIRDDEAEEMEALERDILKGLNVPDPYAANDDHA
ncbi:MAG: rRNA maturation RNase YbeY [Asticcacaulis sp.]|uniref:rRNA maturation RNase YbeY n=1 Tax=Asticcacaulis sp. TaxID=1872648 RepID=UPI003F7BCC07